MPSQPHCIQIILPAQPNTPKQVYVASSCLRVAYQPIRQKCLIPTPSSQRQILPLKPDSPRRVAQDGDGGQHAELPQEGPVHAAGAHRRQGLDIVKAHQGQVIEDPELLDPHAQIGHRARAEHPQHGGEEKPHRQAPAKGHGAAAAVEQAAAHVADPRYRLHQDVHPPIKGGDGSPIDRAEEPARRDDPRKANGNQHHQRRHNHKDHLRPRHSAALGRGGQHIGHGALVHLTGNDRIAEDHDQKENGQKAHDRIIHLVDHGRRIHGRHLFDPVGINAHDGKGGGQHPLGGQAFPGEAPPALHQRVIVFKLPHIGIKGHIPGLQPVNDRLEAVDGKIPAHLLVQQSEGRRVGRFVPRLDEIPIGQLGPAHPVEGLQPAQIRVKRILVIA